MTKLRALWSGDLPLGEAFWTWAVLIGLPLNLATSVAFLALMSADLLWPAFVVGYALTVPYNVLVIVGVWRSATRYDGERQHADLARIVSAAMLLLLTVT